MAQRPGQPTGAEPSRALESVVEEAEYRPRGAMLVTLVYLALIVVMWGYMYWIMLSRG